MVKKKKKKSRAKAHTLAGLLLRPRLSVSCVLVCIVGRRHDDNDNKPAMCYLGAVTGVKCLTDVRADEHISQMLDSEVYEIGE